MNVDISPWRVEFARITVFPAEPRDLSVETGWWGALTGVEPEIRSVSRKLLGFQEEGDFAGGRLNLSAQLERIDWVFASTQVVDIEAPDFRTVGVYPTVLEPLLDGIQKWFKTSPKLKRMAFGGVLLREVDDRVAGYLDLQRYLPSVRIDAGSMRDFLYQVNRPRASGIVKDLNINRLMKWSVSAKRVIAITGGMPIPPVDKGFASRLELDVNTAAEYLSALPQESLGQLINELAASTTEISEKGDVP